MITSIEDVITKKLPILGVGWGIFADNDGFEEPISSHFIRTSEGDVEIMQSLAEYLVQVMGIKEI
jgi:hypothetical protein